MDSRKQSLFPKPSAARQSFCCSLWIVAEHCRTTSSSCINTQKDIVTNHDIYLPGVRKRKSLLLIVSNNLIIIENVNLCSRFGEDFLLSPALI